MKVVTSLPVAMAFSILFWPTKRENLLERFDLPYDRKNMTSLTNPNLIKAKGLLFLFLGLLSALLLFLEHPSLNVGVLLTLAIWSFCRFYYFAFYVIEYYVNSDYRFSGLISFARYLIWKEQKKE